MDDSEGVSGFALFLFAAGPATGIFVWARIQAKYRNRAARYMPERVVAHKLVSITNEDTFVKKTVSQSSSLSGRNEASHHERAKFTKTVKG